MLRARDLMETHVVTVSPETSLAELYRLFAEEQIGAVPVVDETERVIGVVSSIDLLRALAEDRDTTLVDTRYLRDLLPYSSPDWDAVPEDLQDRLGQRRASDAMTEGIVSVAPDASAAEVAAILRKNRLHHVFVIEDDLLAGVISSFDLLRVVERARES